MLCVCVLVARDSRSNGHPPSRCGVDRTQRSEGERKYGRSPGDSHNGKYYEEGWPRIQPRFILESALWLYFFPPWKRNDFRNPPFSLFLPLHLSPFFFFIFIFPTFSHGWFIGLGVTSRFYYNTHSCNNQTWWSFFLLFHSSQHIFWRKLIYLKK